MLGAYGKWAAGLLEGSSLEKPGPLSFRNPRWKDPGKWKTEARARVAELLAGPGEPAGPVPAPEARVLRRFEASGLVGEELEWQLPYGPSTCAVLLKPSGARGGLPAILALHDHAGNKYFGAPKIARTESPPHPVMLEHQETYYGGRAWANELAARGYAVLASDAFLFGSRRALAADLPPLVVERMLRNPLEVRELTPHDRASGGAGIDVSPEERPEEIQAYNAFTAEHEHLVAKSLFSAGTTWPGVFLWEDQAALSYILSRPEVDPDRVGCCGLSGGGLRSSYLAGMDERIRCSVTVGFMTTWRDFALSVSHTHTWMTFIPGLPRLMDFPEILSLHLPAPALVLHTRGDPLFTLSEAERAGEILARCYRKAGAPAAFRMSLHDGPHKFDVPMQEEAFAWFDRWLR